MIRAVTGLGNVNRFERQSYLRDEGTTLQVVVSPTQSLKVVTYIKAQLASHIYDH